MDDVPTTGRRGRPQIAMTVHPDTVTRMSELCARFALPRGQLVDKLVLALHNQYARGVVFCVNGQPCAVNRTDVPAIF